MSEVLIKIQKALDEFQARKVALVEELRQEFPKMFVELFANSDTIETISWTQYTPYFNDGEECTFSANVDYLDVNGESDYDRKDLKPFLIEKLTTQEEVAANDILSEKYGYSHMKNRKIGEHGLIVNPNFNEKEGTVFTEIKMLLSSIPDEFLKDLFGDHARITISKDGKVEVEEYEHD